MRTVSKQFLVYFIDGELPDLSKPMFLMLAVDASAAIALGRSFVGEREGTLCAKEIPMPVSTSGLAMVVSPSGVTTICDLARSARDDGEQIDSIRQLYADYEVETLVEAS
jgi:hypothetical protein